jgi:hypothetical protein
VPAHYYCPMPDSRRLNDAILDRQLLLHGTNQDTRDAVIGDIDHKQLKVSTMCRGCFRRSAFRLGHFVLLAHHELAKALEPPDDLAASRRWRRSCSARRCT